MFKENLVIHATKREEEDNTYVRERERERREERGRGGGGGGGGERERERESCKLLLSDSPVLLLPSNKHIVTGLDDQTHVPQKAIAHQRDKIQRILYRDKI